MAILLNQKRVMHDLIRHNILQSEIDAKDKDKKTKRQKDKDKEKGHYCLQVIFLLTLHDKYYYLKKNSNNKNHSEAPCIS